MKNSFFKEFINFILVIIFSTLYFIYLLPLIIDYTNNIFISTGIWCVIVGIWGNLVGMRIVKPIVISNDYKKENYFIIVFGILFILVGLILYIKDKLL